MATGMGVTIQPDVFAFGQRGKYQYEVPLGAAVQIGGWNAFQQLCALLDRATPSRPVRELQHIEGKVEFDDKPVTSSAVGRTFLNANDTLTTTDGKAEVLLTPGVFLRMGPNSKVTMVSPSLTDTRLEVVNGSAMVEVNKLSKDTSIQVTDSGATISLEKTGLYRFAGGSPRVASVYDGKATVQMNDRKVSVGKNKQVSLVAELKPNKFNAKDDQEDDLYAWSKVRDEYSSAASYASLRSVGAGRNIDPSMGYGYDGYGPMGLGYSGLGIRPGWFWNSGFNSWTWLPGTNAFYSPFGYGFYSPSLIGYAPVVYAPLRGRPGTPVAIPVNPTRTPAVAGVARPAVVTPNGGHFGGPQRSALAARTAPGAPAGAAASGAGAHAAAGPGMSGGARSMSMGGASAHSMGGASHK